MGELVNAGSSPDRRCHTLWVRSLSVVKAEQITRKQGITDLGIGTDDARK